MFGRSRLRSIAGGDTEYQTLVSATTTNVPDSSNVFLISGTATITTLNAATSTRGRIVFFISTGTVVFQNTAGTSTAGKMDLGTGDITLSDTDVLCLYLRSNGAWVRLFSTDN